MTLWSRTPAWESTSVSMHGTLLPGTIPTFKTRAISLWPCHRKMKPRVSFTRTWQILRRNMVIRTGLMRRFCMRDSLRMDRIRISCGINRSPIRGWCCRGILVVRWRHPRYRRIRVRMVRWVWLVWKWCWWVCCWCRWDGRCGDWIDDGQRFIWYFLIDYYCNVYISTYTLYHFFWRECRLFFLRARWFDPRKRESLV